jgi:hypothetical protein
MSLSFVEHCGIHPLAHLCEKQTALVDLVIKNKLI